MTRQVAKAVTASVGLSDVPVGPLQKNKLRGIDVLMRDDSRATMVGEVLNDAPALARAAIA